jgi:hypothetical protein
MDVPHGGANESPSIHCDRRNYNHYYHHVVVVDDDDDDLRLMTILLFTVSPS